MRLFSPCGFSNIAQGNARNRGRPSRRRIGGNPIARPKCLVAAEPLPRNAEAPHPMVPSFNRPPLVDIHCHILPNLDDGPDDWRESLAMARLAVADGVSTIIATPHQMGGDVVSARKIRERTEHLRQYLAQHGVPLEIVPGAEVRISPDLVGLLESGEVLTLAEQGRYLLLELPAEVYMPLERPLEDLRRVGITAILAHPERNAGILAHPRVARELVEAGCLLQVTANSLFGAFGRDVQKITERLLSSGLIHFVASDAHGSKSRRPMMRRAFERVRDLAGYQTACEVCCFNAQDVLSNRGLNVHPRVAETEPSRRSFSLARWFQWRRAG